jgi:hypothetical protein
MPCPLSWQPIGVAFFRVSSRGQDCCRIFNRRWVSAPSSACAGHLRDRRHFPADSDRHPLQAAIALCCSKSGTAARIRPGCGHDTPDHRHQCRHSLSSAIWGRAAAVCRDQSLNRINHHHLPLVMVIATGGVLWYWRVRPYCARHGAGVERQPGWAARWDCRPATVFWKYRGPAIDPPYMAPDSIAPSTS